MGDSRKEKELNDNQLSNDQLWEKAATDRPITRSDIGINDSETWNGLQRTREGINFLQYDDHSKNIYKVVEIPLNNDVLPLNIEAAYRLVSRLVEDGIIKECRVNKEKDTAYFKFDLNVIDDWMTEEGELKCQIGN